MKFISKYFNSKATSVYYKTPRHVVIAEIESMLNREKSVFFDENDLRGSLVGEGTFHLGINGGRLSGFGVLVCEVLEVQDGGTEVRLTGKPSGEAYLFMVLFIIVSLILQYRYFESQQFSLLFVSLGCVMLGPLLSIALANTQIVGLRERYYLFIDKRLRAL